MPGNAIGWWEQAGYGRQAMEDLSIKIEGSSISGSGVDVVAPFQIDGHFQSGGIVQLVKSYKDRHQVLYVGTHDGEGRLEGKWSLGDLSGKWSIRLLQPDQPREIVDIG